MKKFGMDVLFMLTFMIVFLSGCAVVEGIFKAGVFVGMLAVIFAIGIVLFIITRIF